MFFFFIGFVPASVYLYPGRWRWAVAFFFGYLYSRSVSLSMFYHFLAKWRWWPIVVVAALFPGISGIIFLLFLLFFFRSWALVAGYTGGGVVPVSRFQI